MKRSLSLALYYFSSLKRNKNRLIEILLWPVFELITFGYLSSFVQNSNSLLKNTIAILLGSLIFWHFFVRISFENYQQLLEDIISKNLQNILGSPITLTELIIGLNISAFIKLIINIITMLITAWWLYQFNIFIVNLGFLIPALFILGLWAVAFGIIILSLLFILGRRASGIGWTMTVITQPFACVFYPRSVLITPFKEISYLFPPSYIFELYRNYLSGNPVIISFFIIASILTFIYLLLAIIVFNYSYKNSRKTGLISRM